MAGPARKRSVVGHLRAFLLALVVPGLLFSAVALSRGGVCLDQYSWDADKGYVPVPARCGPDDGPGFVESFSFYARATSGLVTGQSGRSREDASRSLATLLWLRGQRSAAVLGFALLTLALATALSALLAVILGLLHRGPRPAGRRRGPLLTPGGLPLPIAAFLIFVVVIRSVPPGHALDYDRAGLLWAGVSLALADGAAAVLFLGMRHTVDVEMERSYADSLRLWGADALRAVADVSRGVRSSQVRGAFLALLSGLLVVEGVFGVNGLGETLRDLVVDRQGLDPLMLSNILVVYAMAVFLVDLFPFEAVVRRFA